MILAACLGWIGVAALLVWESRASRRAEIIAIKRHNELADRYNALLKEHYEIKGRVDAEKEAR